jgi:hypothetical protein
MIIFRFKNKIKQAIVIISLQPEGSDVRITVTVRVTQTPAAFQVKIHDNLCGRKANLSGFSKGFIYLIFLVSVLQVSEVIVSGGPTLFNAFFILRP